MKRFLRLAETLKPDTAIRALGWALNRTHERRAKGLLEKYNGASCGEVSHEKEFLPMQRPFDDSAA